MAYKPVTAALRVLDVLVAVNSTSGHATVKDVYNQTGLDKATIIRMLSTLAHAGFITRDQDESSWRVTGRTLQLSSGFNRSREIAAVASEDLARFRHQIGWPSDVAIMDQDAMIVVETSRAAEPMQFSLVPGHRAPALLTSLGRAYLAYCSEDIRSKFLDSAAKNSAPEFDLAREPEALQEILSKIRQDGFATMEESYSREHYDSQFFSIGVPIKSGTAVFGAMNIIYLKQAMTPQEARDKMLAPLQEVANTLAQKLLKQTEL